MAYKKLNATNQADALRQARDLCQCLKMSMDGVQWTETGPGGKVVKTLTWDELKHAQALDNKSK
jgi:hypothetical protein